MLVHIFTLIIGLSCSSILAMTSDHAPAKAAAARPTAAAAPDDVKLGIPVELTPEEHAIQEEILAGFKWGVNFEALMQSLYQRSVAQKLNFRTICEAQVPVRKIHKDLMIGGGSLIEYAISIGCAVSILMTLNAYGAPINFSNSPHPTLEFVWKSTNLDKLNIIMWLIRRDQGQFRVDTKNDPTITLRGHLVRLLYSLQRRYPNQELHDRYLKTMQARASFCAVRLARGETVELTHMHRNMFNFSDIIPGLEFQMIEAE